ncbi:MAG: thioredoxin domain-containing protein [Flavobacteriaceae bacterium]|nr:thioredoxin domain-containing protein [Flavobacteriaceae bacterium]
MRQLITILFLATLLASCTTTKNEKVKNQEHTNDLINETSPYLLQHAHNPVNWNGWNEKTLQEAKDKNKLMIISIGYAACHWCHVMERESFEDSTVASVMNANFISVKVDREERPDVDQVYINAVQLMTGRAGWPLNVITLPDGRPIWGGTYFQKKEWIQAIGQIQTLYEEDPQNLIDYATRLEQGIKSMELVTLNTSDVNFSEYDTKPLINKLKSEFDTELGGTKRVPKFMMPNNVVFWLREAVQNKDENLMKQVTLTLDLMAYGGVYDHIGGGFARYSTDRKWHIPHFEKMLYDNAQLVSLYSNAYSVTKKPLYRDVVEETLSFIAREMTNQEGAFYSSLDADSETTTGELEEGAYYTYTTEELQELLEEDFELFKAYYNINDYGIWEDEGKYVLIRDQSDSEILEAFPISASSLQQKKEHWKVLLLNFRNKRAKPRLDDKTLTSWNALMLKGYVDAYKVFQKKEYLDAALLNAEFISEKQLQINGALYHNYKNGESTINGYLEDTAAVVQAFIALYEVTLDEQWLQKSKLITDYAFENFHDIATSMFYFTSKEDAQIVTRTVQYRDNVIPASNSIMAKNLFILAHHFDEKNYASTAAQMLKNVQSEMEQYPSGFSNWLDLLSNYQSNYYEIVVVGNEAHEKIREINKLYLPGKLIAGSTKSSKSPLLEGRYLEGKTYIYVCVNNTCKLPVTSSQTAMNLLK